MLLAAEGLVQAVQPLLTSPRESDAGSISGGGDGSSISESRNRRGYRSDHDELQVALKQSAALAPSGAGEAMEMGGVSSTASGNAAGAVGALFNGAKSVVKDGVRAGVRAGRALGRQLHSGQYGGQEVEGVQGDLEQGPHGRGTAVG